MPESFLNPPDRPRLFQWSSSGDPVIREALLHAKPLEDSHAKHEPMIGHPPSRLALTWPQRYVENMSIDAQAHAGRPQCERRQGGGARCRRWWCVSVRENQGR